MLVELRLHIRIDRAAVHANSHRTVVVLSHLDQVFHFLLPRLGSFVMVQMSGVVANLVDMRGDDFGEPIILLQVYGQISLHLTPNLHQGFGFFLIVDGDTHDIRAGVDQIINLPHRGVNVGRFGGRHALDGNRSVAANEAVSDGDPASRISNDVQLCVRHDCVSWFVL